MIIIYIFDKYPFNFLVYFTIYIYYISPRKIFPSGFYFTIILPTLGFSIFIFNYNFFHIKQINKPEININNNPINIIPIELIIVKKSNLDPVLIVKNNPTIGTPVK